MKNLDNCKKAFFEKEKNLEAIRKIGKV